jgi:glycosyltransferase involved in cell wall biosynthesis
LKVLVVSTWCPFPADNGSRIRAYHLLSELSSRHEITLLTFTEGLPPAEVRAGLRTTVARVELVDGTAFVRGPLSLRGTFSATPRSLVQAEHPEMRRLVCDLAPMHDVAVGFQVNAAMYLQDCRRPSVFEEAEAGVMLARRLEATGLQRLRREMTWQKNARFMRRLIGQFQRTTVVSRVERDTIAGFGVEAARIAVVPNAADERDLARPRPRRLERLIYPGALSYAANLDAVKAFLETTWPAILRARPDLEFVVTGSHEGVDVARLPNIGRVRFTGRVDDVKSLIAESAAVVVPLRIGGGTRVKILEALALGTPVVSTSKGAEGLDVTPEHDLLIADEADAFSRQVLRVLDEPDLASRLSHNGRALVQRTYTWKRAAEVLDDTLRQASEAARGLSS